METTYDWVFTKLHCIPSLDGMDTVVQTVYWRYIASKGGVTTETYGAVDLPLPLSNKFINFDSVTKNVMINWVSQCINVPSLQTALNLTLDDLINPPTVSVTPPWDLPDYVYPGEPVISEPIPEVIVETSTITEPIIEPVPEVVVDPTTPV